jgi:isocitrate dehydrogenase (NAD+)
VKNATLDLLREGVRTPDLGGGETTDSFTEAVANEVARRVAAKSRPPAPRPDAADPVA